MDAINRNSTNANTFKNLSVQISDEEIERIMSGQEFKDDANMPEHTWGNNGDSDNSSPGNGVSDGNQPSPVSTLSSKWVFPSPLQMLQFVGIIHKMQKDKFTD